MESRLICSECVPLEGTPSSTCPCRGQRDQNPPTEFLGLDASSPSQSLEAAQDHFLILLQSAFSFLHLLVE